MGRESYSSFINSFKLSIKGTCFYREVSESYVYFLPNASVFVPDASVSLQVSARVLSFQASRAEQLSKQEASACF
jgi:hypothetical protein